MTHEGTPITRRSMLQMSWGGFTAAGVAAISRPWRIPGLNRYRLQDVNAETFLPYVGKSLVFHGPFENGTLSCRTVELQLAEVSPHKNLSCLEERATSTGRKRESFSLLFRQVNGKPLGPGLHRLAHADFEDFQILLTQVGVPSGDGATYHEAVFG